MVPTNSGKGLIRHLYLTHSSWFNSFHLFQYNSTNENEEAFLHNALSARNPGRVNEIAANVRCKVCNRNAATQYAFNENLKPQAHREADKKRLQDTEVAFGSCSEEESISCSRH